jgi:hypothetical protein
MANPFPGMNPYLERPWGDVHARLIIYASDQLNARLPGDLRARAEERVYLETPEGPGGYRRPDVRIIEEGWERGPRGGSVGVLEPEVAEPLIFHSVTDPIIETYLKIIDVNARGRVVTGIEILSLTNKLPGDGRRAYLKKQRELKEAGVHSVEIDLLREGGSPLAIPIERMPPERRTPYRACVHRMGDKDQFEVYPFPLRQKLPAIRIPLREEDADVLLDLQALINQAYDNAGYDAIDYTLDADPPLSGEDAVWADALLREKGLRESISQA